jgi:hypothetical protein
MANQGFAEKRGMNPVYCCLAPWVANRIEFDTQSVTQLCFLFDRAIPRLHSLRLLIIDIVPNENCHDS